MPETRGAGRFYWHLQHYPRIQGYEVRIPLSEPAETIEMDYPFRRGSGKARRLWPLRRSLVTGTWKSIHSEEENLAAAARGRQDIATAEEIGLW